MKLQSIELKNYKSHKSFIAKFDGENKLIQGSKGSGKTSIRDAFYWIMTGRLVDDPTPIDKDGEIINHLTISANAIFVDGTSLKIESNQAFKKDGTLKANHNQTFYINEVPVKANEYEKYLESKYGTLEQRKIMLDPTWFAYGNGLAITGATPKTEWQRRREIVIQVSGSEDIEQSIIDNDNKLKQSKFAIGSLKKELDSTNAGIESLEDAKHDVSSLDETYIQQQLDNLNKEKEIVLDSMSSVDDNEQKQLLKRALSDAQTELSNEQANYISNYNKLLEKALKPLNEYENKKRELISEINRNEYLEKQQEIKRNQLLYDLNRLNKQREDKLDEYNELNKKVFIPESTICNTCHQPLPHDSIVASEARFNQNKSEQLEQLVIEGKLLANNIAQVSKEIELLNKTFDTETYRKELDALVEPVVEYPVAWDKTELYQSLNKKIIDAKANLENDLGDAAKDIYQRKLNDINYQISQLQNKLNLFATNKHLETQIDNKATELQSISTKIDDMQAVVDSCNEFTRKTLNALEENIQKTFEGLSFKMFEFTLNGDQKDICKTYGLTDRGFIPYENLSGGQKRTTTIQLANAFKKAWGVEIPLFIDDTQIYNSDELIADMQLIRITEVPYAELEVK